MQSIAAIWSTVFGFLPPWFAAFVIAGLGLLALLIIFWILKIIWDSIPFV